jgi:hypothetical protein
MKRIRTMIGLLAAMALLAGCQPKILSYDIQPSRTVGLYQPVTLTWRVRGKATLQISDAKYDEQDSTTLKPLTLAITGKNGRRTILLSPGHPDTLHLESEGTLQVVKVPDQVIDERLRTFALVATKDDYSHPDFQRPVVAVLTDSATAEIGNRRNAVRGDTLIAKEENNPVRWGKFSILSVRNNSARPLLVIHNGISRTLLPGALPDLSFRNTPVKGTWEFRARKTPEEMANPRLYATSFKITITVKP